MLVTNVCVYGIDESVTASKYPFLTSTEEANGDITKTTVRLAQSPIGCGEDQFLTGITVQFDLTFSNKAWVEAERYRFLYFVSSQSTMHRITAFDIDEQCNEYVENEAKSLLKRLVSDYKTNPTTENYLKVIYNVPSGFRLTARLSTNYRQLKTIYRQRRLHRLPEWREFCEWIETLPHAELIIGNNKISVDEYKRCKCPNDHNITMFGEWKPPYCPFCGVKIDWSEYV